MGGPGSGRHRQAPRAAPRGAWWREVSAAVIARDRGICYLCGHPGATQADHVEPMKAGTVTPRVYLDPRNLRAAHGGSRPCPVCGRRCNQIKGDRAVTPALPEEPERITLANVSQAMRKIKPHIDPCSCRERMLSNGIIPSKCW